MNPGEIAMREDSQSRMIVVLHWHEELKRLCTCEVRRGRSDFEGTRVSWLGGFRLGA